MALRIVRKSGWHCAFTRACVFESLGPGWRETGTNLVFCSAHRPAADLMRHTGGRDGSEAMARVNPMQNLRKGAS